MHYSSMNKEDKDTGRQNVWYATNTGGWWFPKGVAIIALLATLSCQDRCVESRAVDGLLETETRPGPETPLLDLVLPRYQRSGGGIHGLLVTPGSGGPVSTPWAQEIRQFGALSAVTQWTLPDTLALSGAFLSTDGSVVLVLDPPRGVLLLDPTWSSAAHIPIGSAPGIVSANHSPDRGLEIAMRDPSTVYRVDSTGRMESRLDLPGDGWLVAAAPLDDGGWVTLSAISASHYAVCVHPGGARCLDLSLGTGREVSVGGWISLEEGHALVALRDPRLPVVRVELETRREALFEVALPEDEHGSGHWVSMPIVPIDGGYLQTLSDLMSDDRVFVLYDADGLVLSRRTLSLPISLVAARRGRGDILGARRHSHVELVKYEWRWNPNRCPDQ